MKLVTITPDQPLPEGCLSGDPILGEIVVGTMQMYSKSGFIPPWSAYLARHDEEWVGTCAFKRPPEGNRVEIAYFTLPNSQRKGMGTRMAQLLVEIARQTQPGITIYAQTLPEPNASTRILEKLGFSRTAEIQHPDDGLVWEWELRQQPDAT